jgi:cell fate regulator YaaT (PSP1 superfamily)
MSDEKSKKDSSYLPRSWGSASAPRSKACEDCAPHAEPIINDTESAGPGELNEIESEDRLALEQVADEIQDDSEEALSPLDAEADDLISWQAANKTPSLPFRPDPPSGTTAEAGSEDVPAGGQEVGGRHPELMNVNIVGVRFGYACKVYHFDSGEMDLAAGDWVIVKTEKGTGLGQIALAPFERQMDATQFEGLRKVIRKAGKVDFDQKERCSQREAEAYTYCLERIEALQLPMKLVAVECFFDGSKYVFYFTAEGRVDFRELVKQLVSRFPVRIEMRQIGVRHEAKMTGGLACCGQELCCARFLTDFRPVSVKMAKNQNLSLNPTKISGVCGRLMCCLGYEHDIYEEFRKQLPKVGKTVKTQKGDGVVLKHNPLAETIFVKVDEETIVEVTKGEIVHEAENLGRKKGVEGKKAKESEAQACGETIGNEF